MAAGGALYLARRADLGVKRVATEEPVSTILASLPDRSVLLIALTLALSGFAAMGFEILWFRHFTLLLGGFRAVFSLLLTVILGGIAAGSLLGGLLLGRHGDPARLLMAVQALFVASSLAGLAAGDAAAIRDSITAAAASADAAGGTPGAFVELWFNLGPILLGAGIPALLMGLGFPLANAIVQRAEYAVGRRAGVLYLSNTAGAVCGSLMTGFLLLPALGIQGTATALAAAAALAVVPLALATAPRAMPALAGSMLIAMAAMAAWILLPSNHVLARTLVVPSLSGRVLTLSEGITEVIAVTEAPRAGRTLFTNGHPMSSTDPLAQRYMRALAHIPLLSIDRPERVLVIGFGVGNTAHAATLHPSIERVDLVDLSRHVLDHASYFSETNGSVLTHPRVVVHVNDGRQHLQMQERAAYDLITLEPPPIVHAGVGALYSREFYGLARTRLKPNGFLSQWLPVYQVPEATALGMIRAFLDVFPAERTRIGRRSRTCCSSASTAHASNSTRKGSRPLFRGLPTYDATLQRLDLGTVREIVGTFVGSAETLAEATRAPFRSRMTVQSRSTASSHCSTSERPLRQPSST